MNPADVNRYWKPIIDTMSEGLMLIGPDGNILAVNRSFERLTGYEAGEVIGRPCTRLDCDACEIVRKESGRFWCMLFDREQVIRKRCLVLRKDGTTLQVLKNASLLRDEQGEPLGAVETLTDVSDLERLDRELHCMTRRFEQAEGFQGLLGDSAPMRQVYEVIEKAAQSDAPVIIFGESGTGKELVAHAIHRIGRRREGPFVRLNCAALNEALLESELFGHIKGAFTGAYRHRMGRFEAANGGDLFLDEIGDVPLALQVKLLRVLESKEFERVGDHRPIRVDVRIITATNKDLQELIAEKRFREDLFFRINVIPIHLPPLRERKGDIPALVNAFLGRLRKKTGKEISRVSQEAMRALLDYHWPGNVRELKSALEYAFVIADKGVIQPAHLPPRPGDGTALKSPFDLSLRHGEPEEKRALVEALREAGGNQSQAARILGVSRVTVWNRMKKYGIDLKKVMVS